MQSVEPVNAEAISISFSQSGINFQYSSREPAKHDCPANLPVVRPYLEGVSSVELTQAWLSLASLAARLTRFAV
jgi:hypothetical protein